MIRRKFIAAASVASAYRPDWLCKWLPYVCDPDPTNQDRSETKYIPGGKTVETTFEIQSGKLGAKNDTVGYSIEVRGSNSGELYDSEEGEFEIV